MRIPPSNELGAFLRANGLVAGNADFDKLSEEWVIGRTKEALGYMVIDSASADFEDPCPVALRERDPAQRRRITFTMRIEGYAKP